MSAVQIVRIDQGHVRNAINAATAATPARRVPRLRRRRRRQGRGPDGDDGAFCAGRQPQRTCPRCAPSGPLGPTRLQLSKPVIAAIEGWCVAGGLELAAWCDLRVCGESARFGCLERRWGVPLIDGGTVPPAPDRRPRPGPRPDPHRARVRRRRGLRHRVRQPGRARRRRARRRGRARRADRLAPVDCRRPRPGVGLRGPRAPLDAALANEDRHGRAVIFDPGFADGVARFERAAALIATALEPEP